MNTAKIYHDSEGNERSIGQMVKQEPHWAANRLQEGEKALDRVESLETAICCFVREEFRNMNFESDKEAVDYVMSFLDT